MVAPPAVCDDLASSTYSPGPAAETFKLAIPRSCHPFTYVDVPRVWTGLWQLSSPAWGTAPAARIRREMRKHVDKGFVAFGEYPLLSHSTLRAAIRDHPLGRPACTASSPRPFPPFEPMVLFSCRHTFHATNGSCTSVIISPPMPPHVHIAIIIFMIPIIVF